MAKETPVTSRRQLAATAPDERWTRVMTTCVGDWS